MFSSVNDLTFFDTSFTENFFLEDFILIGFAVSLILRRSRSAFVTHSLPSPGPSKNQAILPSMSDHFKVAKPIGFINQRVARKKINVLNTKTFLPFVKIKNIFDSAPRLFYRAEPFAKLHN